MAPVATRERPRPAEARDEATTQAADYLTCPLDAPDYNAFVRALRAADRHEGQDWKEIPYFEGCLPIEEMAERGYGCHHRDGDRSSNDPGNLECLCAACTGRSTTV